MILNIKFCATFRKVTFILSRKNCALVGRAQADDACGRIDLIDKHIARCEQIERLAGALGGRSIFTITFHKQNCRCANACPR